MVIFLNDSFGQTESKSPTAEFGAVARSKNILPVFLWNSFSVINNVNCNVFSVADCFGRDGNFPETLRNSVERIFDKILDRPRKKIGVKIGAIIVIW